MISTVRTNLLEQIFWKRFKMRELQEKYSLPGGWEWTRLKNISLKIHYGYTASATQNNTGIKLLRITDIQNNRVDWESVPFCNIQPDDIEKFELKENTQSG